MPKLVIEMEITPEFERYTRYLHKSQQSKHTYESYVAGLMSMATGQVYQDLCDQWCMAQAESCKTKRYILGRSRMSDSYLYQTAKRLKDVGSVCIIEVVGENPEHATSLAQYQLDRLGSGMERGSPKVLETLVDAEQEAVLRNDVESGYVRGGGAV